MGGSIVPGCLHGWVRGVYFARPQVVMGRENRIVESIEKGKWTDFWLRW